ncbi:hypothetical protein M8818_001041 [Zalaria obscura]|uniref:Uncharacterized protein n=1 Tax=Zalaria obscura TaxID=2024903 RepID=A0ACC3SLF6_9PEZI
MHQGHDQTHVLALAQRAAERRTGFCNHASTLRWPCGATPSLAVCSEKLITAAEGDRTGDAGACRAGSTASSVLPERKHLSGHGVDLRVLQTLREECGFGERAVGGVPESIAGESFEVGA